MVGLNLIQQNVAGVYFRFALKDDLLAPFGVVSLWPGFLTVLLFEAGFVLVGQLFGRVAAVVVGMQLFGNRGAVFRNNLSIEIVLFLNNGYAGKHLL